MQAGMGSINLLAALALAGCATGGTTPPAGQRGAMAAQAPGNCTDSSPTIVNITQVDLSGSSPSIKVTPGRQAISMSGQWVRWQIAGNQHAFTSDGVSFPTSKNATLPAMTGSALGSAGDVYDICFGDTSSTPNVDWPYDIKLFANGSPTIVWKCDPTIVNSASIVTASPPLNVSCTRQ